VRRLTPENEAEWLEFARTHTNREIEFHVSKKERADGTETMKVTSELTATDRQAVRKARRKLQQKTGKSIRPTKLFAEMAKSIAEGDLFGGADGERKAGSATAFVSIQPCPECLDVFTPVPEGLLKVSWKECFEAVRSGAEVFDQIAHFFCDCEREKHRKDRCDNWKLSDTTPPESRYLPVMLRKEIQARDGFVCRNPACRCEGPLQDSHLEPFCEGAPSIKELIRQHCGTCNELIRTERLRVVGKAPYERYYDAEGTFLGFGYGRSGTHVGRGSDKPNESGPEPPEGGGDSTSTG
jgi:hypothetical protein